MNLSYRLPYKDDDLYTINPDEEEDDKKEDLEDEIDESEKHSGIESSKM